MSLPPSNFPLGRDSHRILPLSAPEDHERSPSIPPSNQLGSSEKWLRSSGQRPDDDQTPLKRRRSGRIVGESLETETGATKRKKRPVRTAGQIRRTTDADRLEEQSQWIATLAEAAKTAIASGIEKAIAAGIETAIAKGIEKLALSKITNAAVAANEADPLPVADRTSPSEDESLSDTRLDDAPHGGRDATARPLDAQGERPFVEGAVVRTPDGRFAKKRRVAKQVDAQVMPTNLHVRNKVTKTDRAKHAVSAPLARDSNGSNRRAAAGEQINSPLPMTDSIAEHVGLVDALLKHDRRKSTDGTVKNAIPDHTTMKNNSGKEQRKSQMASRPLIVEIHGASQGTKRKRETRICAKSVLVPDSPEKDTAAGRNASPSTVLLRSSTGDDLGLSKRGTQNGREKYKLKEKADDAAANKDRLRKDARNELMAADEAVGPDTVRMVDRVEIPVKSMDTVDVIENQKPKESNVQRKKRKKSTIDVEQAESATLDDRGSRANGDHEKSGEGLDMAATGVMKRALSKECTVEGEDTRVTGEPGVDIERRKRRAGESREKRMKNKALTQNSVIHAQQPHNQRISGDEQLIAEETTPIKELEVVAGRQVVKARPGIGKTQVAGGQWVQENKQNVHDASKGANQDTTVSQQRRDNGTVTDKHVSVAETGMIIPDDSEGTTDDSDPECHRDLELPCGHKRRKNWNASLFHIDREGHRSRIGTWEELWHWTTRSKFSAQHPTVYKITPRSICPRCPGTSDRGRISGRHYFGKGYYWLVTHFQPPSRLRCLGDVQATKRRRDNQKRANFPRNPLSHTSAGAPMSTLQAGVEMQAAKVAVKKRPWMDTHSANPKRIVKTNLSSNNVSKNAESAQLSDSSSDPSSDPSSDSSSDSSSAASASIPGEGKSAKSLLTQATALHGTLQRQRKASWNTFFRGIHGARYKRERYTGCKGRRNF